MIWVFYHQDGKTLRYRRTRTTNLKQMENDKAFKHWINQAVVSKLTQEIKIAYPDFKAAEFTLLNIDLESLELKARVKLVAENLAQTLPKKYSAALSILLQVVKSKKLANFELWPISDYISTYGLTDFDKSIEALKILTTHFTSEFAIRPFILADTKKTLKYLNAWTADKNVHVRRLVSEGSRPLLPWGQKLHVFITRPEQTISLLDKLKYDEELYVRKSIANHLNDIAKFNPDLVIQTLTKWQGSAPKKHQTKIEWLTKHALRTLIKKGHKEALILIGVSTKPLIKLQNFTLLKNSYKIGDNLQFALTIESLSKSSQKIVLDYLIYYRKANGSLSPKVFKLKTFELLPNQKITIEKKHSLREVTTRKYYSGAQEVALQINGVEAAREKWELRFR